MQNWEAGYASLSPNQRNIPFDSLQYKVRAKFSFVM